MRAEPVSSKEAPNEVTDADGGKPLRFSFGAQRPAAADFCRYASEHPIKLHTP